MAMDRGNRAVHVVLGLEGIERVCRQHLTRRIHNGRFHTCPDTGVEAQNRLRTGRGSQQQILQVAGKDLNGLFMGAGAHFAHQIDHHGQRQFDAPRPARHGSQPVVAFTTLTDVQRLRHNARRAGCTGFGIGRNIQRYDTLIGSTQHCQCTVRGNVCPFFPLVKIVLKFGTFSLFPRDDRRGEPRLCPHEIAQAAQQCGVFGQAFGDDVARTVQGRFYVGHVFGEVGCGQGLGVDAAIVQDAVGQRFQAIFLGDGRLGAPFGAIGQVDVFQLGLGCRVHDGTRQFVGQLVLGFDGFKDGRAAGFQFAQVRQPISQRAQLGIVQAASGLFPVAGDERNGRSFVQQFYGGIHLTGLCRNVSGDQLGDTCVGVQGGLRVCWRFVLALGQIGEKSPRAYRRKKSVGLFPDVELHPVVHDFIADFCGQFGLQLFDAVRAEFDHFASVHIDHVIVVVIFGFLKAGRGAVELMPLDHALILKRGQGAVDCGQRQAGHILGRAAVQFHGVGMVICACDHGQQSRPLAGDAHTCVAQGLGQVICFGHALFFGTGRKNHQAFLQIVRNKLDKLQISCKCIKGQDWSI